MWLLCMGLGLLAPIFVGAAGSTCSKRAGISDIRPLVACGGLMTPYAGMVP